MTANTDAATLTTEASTDADADTTGAGTVAATATTAGVGVAVVTTVGDGTVALIATTEGVAVASPLVVVSIVGAGIVAAQATTAGVTIVVAAGRTMTTAIEFSVVASSTVCVHTFVPAAPAVASVL